MESDYTAKYIKYKTKYLILKRSHLLGGAIDSISEFSSRTRAGDPSTTQPPSIPFDTDIHKLLPSIPTNYIRMVLDIKNGYTNEYKDVEGSFDFTIELFKKAINMDLKNDDPDLLLVANNVKSTTPDTLLNSIIKYIITPYKNGKADKHEFLEDQHMKLLSIYDKETQILTKYGLTIPASTISPAEPPD